MKVMCKGSGMLLRTTLVWSNLHWKQNILLTRPNVCQFFFMETVCPLLASARAGARLQPYFHGAACWQLHRQKSRCDLFGEHSISCANLTVMMDLLVHLLHFSKSFAGRCNVCILVSGPIGITWSLGAVVSSNFLAGKAGWSRFGRGLYWILIRYDRRHGLLCIHTTASEL